ncbi:MAG: hypothetical protein AAB036_07260 [Elusimicrobiota bacterium]
MKGFLVVGLLTAAVIPAGAAGSISHKIPPGTRAALQEGLDFLEAIKGGPVPESALHRRFFGGPVSGGTYVAFVDRGLKEYIEFDDPRPGEIAAVYWGSGKVSITSSFEKLELVKRAAVLIHEAYHGQEDDMEHVRCPKHFVDDEGRPIVSDATGEPIAEKYACDEDADKAYAHGYVFLMNLAMNCSNCSEEVRSRALYWAKRSYHRVINEDARRFLKQDSADEGR